MLPLGPYQLSVTNLTPIQVEWDQLAQPPIGIDLQNNSGLLLETEIAGQSQWVQPWTASYFPLPSATISILVTPQSAIIPSSGDPLTLTANIYQVGDTPPAITTRNLTATGASQGIVIGKITAPPAWNEVQTFTVPPGISVLGAFTENSSSGFPVFTVAGAGSGYLSIDVQQLPIGNFFYQGLIAPTIDQVINVNLNNTGINKITSAWIVGYGSPPTLGNRVVLAADSPFSYVSSTAAGPIGVPATSGNVNLVPAPPVGYVNRILNIQIWLPSTAVANNVFLRVQGAASGAYICAATPQAGPVSVDKTCNLPLSEGVQAINNTAVSGASVSAFYRLEQSLLGGISF